MWTLIVLITSEISIIFSHVSLKMRDCVLTSTIYTLENYTKWIYSPRICDNLLLRYGMCGHIEHYTGSDAVGLRYIVYDSSSFYTFFFIGGECANRFCSEGMILFPILPSCSNHTLFHDCLMCTIFCLSRKNISRFVTIYIIHCYEIFATCVYFFGSI